MRFIKEEVFINRAKKSADSNGYNDGNTALIEAFKRNIESLENRVNNLSAFRDLFFIQQKELIQEKEQNQALITKLKELGHSPEDLNIQSVDVLKESASKITDTSSDLEHAKELILLSLSLTNEYHALLDTLFDTNTASSYQTMADALLSSLEYYGLTGAVQIHSRFHTIDQSLDEDMHDEYKGLIQKFKESGDLHHESNIYIFNTKNLSLLIDNLPEEKELIDRYTQYITHIMSASDVKLNSLDNQKYLGNQKKNLKTLVEGTYTSINLVKEASSTQAEEIQALFDSLNEDLITLLENAQLSKKDNTEIIKLINSKKDALTETLSDSLALDDKFVDAIKKLKHSFTPSKTDNSNSK